MKHPARIAALAVAVVPCALLIAGCGESEQEKFEKAKAEVCKSRSAIDAQVKTLSSLPPSVLGVLEGERNGGNFNPLHSATLGEWELATGNAVSGYKTLTITIAQE